MDADLSFERALADAGLDDERRRTLEARGAPGQQELDVTRHGILGDTLPQANQASHEQWHQSKSSPLPPQRVNET